MAKTLYPQGSIGALYTPDSDYCDLFLRWGLSRTNPDARDVARDLQRTWPRWPIDLRLELLDVIDALVRAERAASDWKPKEIAQEYQDLARVAIQAAAMVKTIAARFPPPWSDGDEAVRRLSSSLLDLTELIVEETLQNDKAVAVAFARDRLRALRARAPKRSGRFSWELVSRLVWLASGQETLRHESYFRKYGADLRPEQTPAATLWRRRPHAELLIEVRAIAKSLPASERNPEAFEGSVRKALKKRELFPRAWARHFGIRTKKIRATKPTRKRRIR